MGRPRHPAVGRSGAGHRSRTLHRRSCRRALHSLRAQPGRLRAHRPHHGAGRREDLDRRGPRWRAADLPDAAQIRLSADRAATLGEGRRALCRRAGRRGLCADRAPKPRTSPIASRSRSTNCRRWPTRATRYRRMRRASMTAAMSWSTAGSRPRISTRLLPKRTAAFGSSVRSRRQNATPLEARAAHAAFDPATGRTTLTCTTQMPHLTRTAIADILGFAESDLRVIAPDVGGGFGQKMSLAAEYVVLVVAGAAVARQRRLDRGPARESDRRFP